MVKNKVVSIINKARFKLNRKKKTNRNDISILDQYSLEMPSSQNSINIFEGEWSSIIPNHQTGGSALLFDDDRISLIEKSINGFNNKKILELGPLEGGHTYMMSKRGAKEIIAIEANSRAFFKCLIVKEIFQMKNVTFLFGGFEKYLEQPIKYDFVLASGVIYHCLDPLKILHNITQTTNTIGIWSHYFDEDICKKIYKNRFDYNGTKTSFQDFNAKYYSLSYGAALNWSGFCGGANPTTNWMTKEDWISYFEFLGFDFTVLSESTTHPNGPEFTAIAVRKEH